MRGYQFQAALVLASALSACGSTPPQPAVAPGQLGYWMDPWWQASLLTSIQSVVHTTDDAGDASRPDIVATVRFTLRNGKMEDPEIAASTGNVVLDELLLRQVASATIPKIYGPYADEPHTFELQLSMLPPTEFFEYNVYAAINLQKYYPKESLIRGAMGNTTVDFDYLDGKASNIVLAKSSRDKDLDKASLSAVTRATLPAALPKDAGKPLHMEVIVCYGLNNANSCPSGKNVIEVRGVRVKTVQVRTVPSGY